MKLTTRAVLLAGIGTFALAGCSASPPPADPTGRADSDMAKVLTAYRDSGAQPVDQLTVEQARRQPTIGDAALQVQMQTTGQGKLPIAKVQDIQVQGATGPLAARVYDPQVNRGGPAPLIVYFHGGGWVTGTLDTYDATDRALAAQTGAVVLSVAYRLAPEAKFPAANDDADAAYQWATQNAATLGADPKRIALAGESAGGNLAIDAAIWARDNHLPMPVHELLVYPVAGTDLHTKSYEETTDAKPLNRRAVEWYVKNYTNGSSDLKDPRLNVVGAADLHGLPPVTIVAADIDPLRSEDEALGVKLQAAGVDVQQQTFPGVTHEFFGMGGTVSQAKKAEDFAVARLKASFAATPQPEASLPHTRHHVRRVK